MAMKQKRLCTPLLLKWRRVNDMRIKEIDQNVFKKGAASANKAAHTATAMHSKIDARLKNTPSIAKTQAFKDYEKGNQQRKIKAMKQGMPYGRQDGPSLK